MADFEIFAIDVDDRLKAICATGRASYEWYLTATEGAEDNLSIQRKIIGGRKSYQTLRADLERGCVLPPIVLATKDISISTRFSYRRLARRPNSSASALRELRDTLSEISQDKLYIVDGLQRTNALRQVRDDLEGDSLDEFLKRKVRLEIWLNVPFGALAYRMLLLNAGQRPMSIAHQVEILSNKLAEDLVDIDGIEIFKKGDSRRRVAAGQFALSRVAQAFQAWLQGQPTLDIRNTVMEQLLAESAIETLGQSLAGPMPPEDRDEFHRFFKWVVDLDHKIDDSHREFLGSETVLQGISAAYGNVTRHSAHKEKASKAAKRLLRRQKEDHDELQIDLFNSLRSGIDAKRQNIGDATREMVFRAFEEYFRNGGDKDMEECWKYGAR